MDLSGEKTFESARKITYLLQKSETENNHLVVIFSAFNPPGTQPGYSYIRTLEHLDCNKLFILDNHGERGCYYLGENKDLSVEASVAALITHIANQNRIPARNIITCGSSKGGYAALYFGIKYGFGHVISGAPQTFLGSYISTAAPDTMRYIAGDTSENSKQYLNRLLYDVVQNAADFPNICIHVGKGDHHYNGHVLPLVEAITTMGARVALDVGDYSEHGEVKFYQDFMKRRLPEIIPNLREKFDFRIFDVKVDCDQQKKATKFCLSTTAIGESLLYAWYVLKDGERIHNEWYRLSNEFAWTTKEKGQFKFIAFIKNGNGEVKQETSEQINVS